MKKLPFDTKKLVIYAILLLLFFLLMGLSSKFNDLTKLTEQHEMLRTSVAELEATNFVINEQIGYATSEAAVEDYAREQGYMVKPGEVLVIPLSQNNATPTPVVLPTQITEQVPNWKIWYQLFFADNK
jgi:cell division protein FtsB